MDKDNEAIALATSIFVAGFFLGVGTGILLAPHTGNRTRERLKSVTQDLLDDATKTLVDAIETGKQLLVNERATEK